jgi:hypothetical protein
MAGAAFDLDLVNNYRLKYVAYLDLLGFRQLVGRSGQDVMLRQRMIEARPQQVSESLVRADVFRPLAENNSSMSALSWQELRFITCLDLPLSATVVPSHDSPADLAGSSISQWSRLADALLQTGSIQLSAADNFLASEKRLY